MNIYLGILIAKNKYLNKYQKINCILKILDKLSMQALILNKEELFTLTNIRNISDFLMRNCKKNYFVVLRCRRFSISFFNY